MIKKNLENALLLEEKGYHFYQELRENATSKLSQKLFDSLAAQELYHMEIIHAYGATAEYKKVEFDPMEKVIKDIFVALAPADRFKDLSQLEGIEKAMQMEKAGYEAYKQAIESTDNESDKAFFKFLMDMEVEHYESLANIHYYYSDNEHWTSEDESQVWSWMNL